MSKIYGESKSSAPKSIHQIGMDLASGIMKKDERYTRFYNYVPVPKLMPVVETDKPITAVFGGNKSTKTTFGVWMAIVVYTGIIPPSIQGRYHWEETLRDIAAGPNARPRRVRIIVQSYTKHYPETIEPFLTSTDLGMLPEAWSNWNNEKKMFTGPDGSYLSIVAVNPHEKVDPNVLRGPLIDHTLTDEINHYNVYGESVARAASIPNGPRSYMQVYCPQEGLECWTFETFYKACYLRKGGKSYRKKPEECHPDIFSMQVCMKDNPSITQAMYESQRRRFRPWEVAFRVDGEYSNRTSNPYFYVEHLIDWEDDERYSPGSPVVCQELQVNPEEGVFSGEIEILDDEQQIQPGEKYDEEFHPVWRVWELPKDGESYVMTADISEGNENSDFHCVDIWNATDPQRPYQAAQLHIKQIKPGNLAIQACCMANVYGQCLIVPEVNNTGGGIFIDRARNYENLYSRISGEKEYEKQTEKIGWHTNTVTKGAMLDDTYKMLMSMAVDKIKTGRKDDQGNPIYRNHCPFNSRATLLEFMSYEERIDRNKDGIARTVWGARVGAHDDCVIASAIAMRIIKHENDKITPCILRNKMVGVLHDEHYLGKKSKPQARAFSKMKSQKKLTQLRKQHGRRSR